MYLPRVFVIFLRLLIRKNIIPSLLYISYIFLRYFLQSSGRATVSLYFSTIRYGREIFEGPTSIIKNAGSMILIISNIYASLILS